MISVPLHRTIVKAMAGVTMEATDIIAKVKAVKSETEIRMIREACRITDEGFKVIIENVKPGKAEWEIANAAVAKMYTLGIDELAFPTTIVSGPDLVKGLPWHKVGDRKVQPGDMFTIDIGVRYKGYCSDVQRGIFWGSVSKEMKDIINTAHASLENGEKKIRPGMKATEADKTIRDVQIEAGYGEYADWFSGHGCGIDPEDEPLLAQEKVFLTKDEMVLEPNMVMAIKGGIFVPGTGGIRTEDIFVLRETGLELLSHAPREIFL